MPDEAEIYRGDQRDNVEGQPGSDNGAAIFDRPLPYHNRPKATIDELRDRARAASPEVMRWLEALLASGQLNGHDGSPGFPGPPGAYAGVGAGLRLVNGIVEIDPEQLRPLVREQINVIERLAGLDDKTA